MKYETPEMEIQLLEISMVITTSLEFGEEEELPI